ncbi:MAG TPA: CBS domain-containing protein [Bryobacteraceae bacterium]|nr:CBS domain-containing protein [Bryobacteraceae bacterium]
MKPLPMRSLDPVDSVLRMKGREVWSIAPTATVYEAIARMSSRGVGALLVLHDGNLEGIVSERDYARKVILQDRSPRHTRVRDIMTERVIAAKPDTTVEECIRLMSDGGIRHMPILDGDRIAGVVSLGDLVNWTVTSDEETIDQLEGYIEGRYPG